MTALTTKSLLTVKPGQTLRCTKVPGLHVRAFDKRTSFYLYYRTKTGAERRPKIGDYPTLNLMQARDIAKDMLAEVAKGNDPSRERAASRQAIDMEAFCELYMEHHGNLKQSGGQDKYRIDKFILPHFGKRAKVVDITYDDVKALHDKLADKPVQANRIYRLLSVMFNLAEAPLKIRPPMSNPCHGIKQYRERSRTRLVQVDEAQRIASLLREYESGYPDAVLFIWLLIMTGARPGEIASAKRSQLNGSRLELEEHKTAGSTGIVRVVRIPPFCMDMLAKRNRTLDDRLVGIKSPRKLWERIRQEADCQDLRLYPDLKKTFASTALSIGRSLDQIAEIFNHQSTQTTKIYAKLMDDTAQLVVDEAAEKLQQMFTTSCAGSGE